MAATATSPSRARAMTATGNGTAPTATMLMVAVMSSTRSAVGSRTLPRVVTWSSRRAS